MEINNVKDIIKMPEISKNILRKMYDAGDTADDFEIARKMDLIKSDKGVELLRWYYENVDEVDLSGDFYKIITEIFGAANEDETTTQIYEKFKNMKISNLDPLKEKPENLFSYLTLAIVNPEGAQKNVSIIANAIKAISLAQGDDIDFDEITDATESGYVMSFAAHFFQLTAHCFTEESLEMFYNYIAFYSEYNVGDQINDSKGAVDETALFFTATTDASIAVKKLRSHIFELLSSTKSAKEFIESLTKETSVRNMMLLMSALGKPSVIINTFRCTFDKTIRENSAELLDQFINITQSMLNKVDDVIEVPSISSYAKDEGLSKAVDKLFEDKKFREIFGLHLVLTTMELANRM